MKNEIRKSIVSHIRCNISSVEEINKGHSSEKKYIVKTEKSKLFVRVLPFTYEIANKYNLLMDVGKKIRAISAPISWFVFGSDMIVLFDWIDGITLEEYFKNKSSIEQIEIALRVGKIIREIHDITRTQKQKNILVDKGSVDVFVNRYLSEECKEIFNSLISNLQNIDLDYSLIHYDLRPANIMIDLNKQISIIDFEYMTYYPSFADLSCNLLFSEKYMAFGYGVLCGYFRGKPSDFFWETQKSLLAVELLRFSNNKRNQEKDIKSKLNLVKKYIFTNQLFPERYCTYDLECTTLLESEILES